MMHAFRSMILASRIGQPSRMLRASGMVARWAFTFCLFNTTTALAQNFTCDDAEIVSRAEQARRESAVYWSGEELPGRWARPCPIAVTPADHEGGGATTFQFSGGEVFGWRMQISGRREALLVDVVPHEVDHMVRASLVRRPIPRWLDEGCASDRESEASQQRLRDETQRLLSSGRLPAINANWLDRMDYPVGSEEIAVLYAVGHSLVEFLIDRAGPRTLLDFQIDPRPPSAKLSEFYGIEVAGIDAMFRAWLKAAPVHHEEEGTSTEGEPHAVECPLLFPGRPCDYDGPNLLTVFTSRACGPCRQFWFDLDSDREFREAICSRFHLHRVDVDLQPMLARQAEIESVPTFVAPRGRIIGYQGKEWLLNELLKLQPAEPINDAAEDTPSATLPSAAPNDVPAADDVAASEVVPAGNPPASVQAATPSTERPGFNPLPIALTLLQWAGVIGGSAATGGVGTLAVWGVIQLLNRRRQRADAVSSAAAGNSIDDAAIADAGEASLRAPFPRQLDEARELLRLGRSEGRVAVLDTLRGMFLDDELDKLAAGSDEYEAWSRQLKQAIDARVDEVAPLSVD